MNVFIIMHKDFPIPDLPSFYIPLQVGAKGNSKLGILSDDISDNISDKNPYYCELTGLYWIWKNVKEDIVGICHYRRYFVSLPAKLIHVFTNKKCGFYSENLIRNKLSKCDLIVHNRTYFKDNIREEFIKVHHSKDLEKTEEIIKNYFPDYIPAFHAVMNGHKVHLLNMIIAKKEILDEYCTWLFSILELLEKQIDVEDYDEYQKRVFGFIAERLLDVWIFKNNKKVKSGFTINLENMNGRFCVK